MFVFLSLKLSSFVYLWLCLLLNVRVSICSSGSPLCHNGVTREGFNDQAHHFLGLQTISLSLTLHLGHSHPSLLISFLGEVCEFGQTCNSCCSPVCLCVPARPRVCATHGSCTKARVTTTTT